MADLLVRNAALVATCDAAGRELPGGWVAVTDGLVSGVGASAEPPPQAARTIDAAGCLVTPGLVNTHHHLYQNLTRSFAPALNGTLFEWLTRLYPVWAGIDEEASYLAAWVGSAELALGGCTSTADHLYIAPRAGGDLWSAQITAAREVGLRFHPTRGSMTVSEKDGGLPPDSVVQDDDTVLADSERLVAAFHDPSPASMLRVGLAPCSPFSVTPALMTATAELAERLDVRLHTHLAEDRDEDAYCLERFGRRPVDQFAEVGWLTPRAWVAHCLYPDAPEITRLGAAGVGVAHCPSSNMMLGNDRTCPVTDLRAAGAPVGLGCDGSSSNDIASLWLEARTALLLGKVRGGPAAMTARPMGAAREPPVASSERSPPFSTSTATAICGLLAGAKATYQLCGGVAFGSEPCSAVPVFAAICTPVILPPPWVRFSAPIMRSVRVFATSAGIARPRRSGWVSSSTSRVGLRTCCTR